MAKKKASGTLKNIRMLIKPGTPFPGEPSMKLESAHMTAKSANKAEQDLLEKPRVKETLRVRVPKQTLLYAKKSRITPKRPRISR